MKWQLSLKNSNKKILKSIMNPNVITAKSNENVKDVVSKMLDYNLNKILIDDSPKPKILEISKITPRILKSNKRLSELVLAEIPMLDSTTEVSKAYPFIRKFPAVAVREDDHIAGIVTMTDYGKNVLKL